MICPHCSTPNPEGVARCQRCSAPLPDSGAARPITLEDAEHDTPHGGLSATEGGSGGQANGSAEGSEDLTMDGSRSTGLLQGRTEVGAGGSGSSSRAGTDSSSGARRSSSGGSSSGGMGTAGERGRLTATDLAVLPEGFEIGHRYRVVRVVGRGGMGAVYLVHDLELDRDVALKIIRPDITDNPTTLDRFKREIMLSSKITHKNVLRVYDLGEADGLKFVTMQFVEGEDLAHLIRREGRLPLERVVDIFKQTCRGLAAAHEQGVVHRDLKPQNIMLDGAGTVFLTDFGLAKSLGDTGFTETGMLMGTPHYMSPEQVRAEQVDARSDIYSLGVILYELCTGQLPFSGGSAFEVMMRRLQKPPKPIGDINPDVPPYLRKILDRCLAVELKDRYQSIGDVLADLETEGQPARGAAAGPGPQRMPWWVVATGAAALAAVIVAGVWWVRTRPAAPPVAQAPRSVLIADFQNLTGDSAFDGTIESALGIALEGAPFITTYNRRNARQVAAQLQPGATRIDEAMARLVAGREGIDVITAGEVRPEGSGYSITVRAIDSRTGKPIATEQQRVSGKEDVLGSVTKLSAGIRKSLGDTTPESVQLAGAETYTAASLEAAHEYAVGQERQWDGKYDEAVQHYERAIARDPNLGRAYSGLATAFANTGRHDEAEKYYKEAMARIDRMSERERYRTRSAYYLTITRDADSAIEELKALVAKYPADNAGHANLAVAYQLKRDFGAALTEGRRALAIYPRDVPRRYNVGLFATFAGDFETAEKEMRAVLEINPAFLAGFQGLALAELAQDRTADARATLQKAEALGPAGASLAATALADVDLYEGQIANAVARLEKAIAVDLAAQDPEAAAVKQVMLAEAHLAEGQPSKAAAEAARARELSQGDVVAAGAAHVFIAAGDVRRAEAIATELDKSLGPEPQMYGRLVRGELQLKQGQAREAVATFKEAQKLVDAWRVRFDLGRAYLEAGAFTEADSQFEQCLKRRGEVTDLFLSEIPTYRMLPPVYYYKALAHEGLGSHDAAVKALQTFVEIKKDGTDPLLADARKRLAAR